MYGWWTQTFNYVYEPVTCQKRPEFNPIIMMSCNFRIIKENYNFDFKTRGASEYSYDKDGNLIQIESVTSDNSITEISFEHDNYGRIIQAKQVMPGGYKRTYHYTYDDSNRIILRYCSQADSIPSFESYIYDNYERLVKSYVRNFTELNLTGYISFTYDNFDRLEKGFFMSAKGLKADIFFTYNSDNNLVEILWNFYDGRFQKYLYEYERVDK